MKHKGHAAFTLIEALTGIVVISTISVCSWLAVSTLFRGEQINRNRTVATNLLQKSQEEIRKASFSFYDQLETCQFPGSAFNEGTNNPCGLQALGGHFNGFTRSVLVTPQNNSTELKQAVITVNWTDQGHPLAMSSAVLLARPPDPLPGNIMGKVRSSAQNNPLISGVTLTATLTGSTTSRTTTSGGLLGAKDENFDFFDSTTGAFVLPVGKWKLSATAPGYDNYMHPVDILITSNAETRVDFIMDPKPTDAKVHIRLIDGMTSLPLSHFDGGVYDILDDYAQTQQVIYSANNSTGGDYAIHFNDDHPRSFTLNTYWAYRSGYSGKPSCSGYNNNFDGWSSAQILADNVTLTCGNPYNGSQISDRITVNPSDDITVQIPLFPVPTATVKGRVVDEHGVPLSEALVYARWPDVRGTEAWWWENGQYPYATTDSNGEYTYTVPATQEMFANTAAGALRLQARKSMSYIGCCDSSQKADRSSPYVAVTNLFNGTTISADDLVISSGGTTVCGNVKGNIKDGSNGLSLNGVTLSIQGVSNTTAGSGDYIYQCPGTGYKLPVGLAKFYSSLTSYYSYDSGGNAWYAAAPSVNIQSSILTNYDSKLWPIGMGKIIVNILDAGTNFPIAGATVKLTPYTGGPLTFTTGNDGIAQFKNVLETWPPADFPADPFYNQTPRSHSLSVKHPSGIYTEALQPIPILKKNDTLIITVKLAPSGGT